MSVRILLVDAHDDARVNLARRLSRDGRLELLGAASTLEEAANVLSRREPDIVLLDIHQNDQRGMEACQALKDLTEAPVVAFTSFITADLWKALQKAGAADSLLKHIDTEHLGGEICRLAERYGRGPRRNEHR